MKINNVYTYMAQFGPDRRIDKNSKDPKEQKAYKKLKAADFDHNDKITMEEFVVAYNTHQLKNVNVKITDSVLVPPYARGLDAVINDDFSAYGSLSTSRSADLHQIAISDIGLFGDSRALPLIMKYFNETEKPVLLQLTYAVEAMVGDNKESRQVLPDLMRVASDPKMDPEIRARVLLCIGIIAGNIGEIEAENPIAWLNAVAENDPDPIIMEAAGAALALAKT